MDFAWEGAQRQTCNLVRRVDRTQVVGQVSEPDLPVPKRPEPDSTEEVGLREVTPAKEMPKVFKVLKKKEETQNTTNWSRRFKANVEKLRSGDIYKVAEVVRSLHQRDKEKGLSAGEKRMLARARQILVSELTFALNVPLLGYVLDSVFQLDAEGWRKLTLRWGLFFFFLAALNEIVWRGFSTDFWVAFKVFGIMPITIAFALSQLPLIQRHQLSAPESG